MKQMKGPDRLLSRREQRREAGLWQTETTGIRTAGRRETRHGTECRDRPPDPKEDMSRRITDDRFRQAVILGRCLPDMVLFPIRVNSITRAECLETGCPRRHENQRKAIRR